MKNLREKMWEELIATPRLIIRRRVDHHIYFNSSPDEISEELIEWRDCAITDLIEEDDYVVVA